MKIALRKFLAAFVIFFSAGFEYKWYSQEKASEFWQYVRFSGEIGLSFGDGFFSGSPSPTAIYQFNKYVSAGVALSRTYSNLKNEYNSTVLGVGILALFNVIPEVQFSTEFEQMHVSRVYKRNFVDITGSSFNRNYWYPALFIGVGYGN